MNVFCLLWVPLFYFFWRSLPENNIPGGVWAFILGSITAVIAIFIDIPLDPGGFGFSRWLYGFIMITFPVMIPLLVYLVLVLTGFVKENHNFSGFTLSWLIPGAILNAISWISLSDPILLVLIPLLWTAIAIGVSYFISFINGDNLIITIAASLGILIVPLAATSSYWAFFSQNTSLGFLFFSISFIPTLLSITFKLLHKF